MGLKLDWCRDVPFFSFGSSWLCIRHSPQVLGMENWGYFAWLERNYTNFGTRWNLTSPIVPMNTLIRVTLRCHWAALIYVGVSFFHNIYRKKMWRAQYDFVQVEAHQWYNGNLNAIELTALFQEPILWDIPLQPPSPLPPIYLISLPLVSYFCPAFCPALSSPPFIHPWKLLLSVPMYEFKELEWDGRKMISLFTVPNAWHTSMVSELLLPHSKWTWKHW